MKYSVGICITLGVLVLVLVLASYIFKQYPDLVVLHAEIQFKAGAVKMEDSIENMEKRDCTQ